MPSVKKIIKAKAVPAETRSKLLEATRNLMLRKGYTATTVDQICAEAKLTKGSFFHYFKSKEEIAEAALEEYCGARVARLKTAPFQALPDPLERFHGWVDVFVSAAQANQAKSCLIGNVSQELAQTHPKFRKKCAEGFAQMMQPLAQTLRAAKEQYPPKIDFEPDSVAAMFFSLLQGSILVSKTSQDADVLSKNLEHYRKYVEGLFGRPRR